MSEMFDANGRLLWAVKRISRINTDDEVIPDLIRQRIVEAADRAADILEEALSDIPQKNVEEILEQIEALDQDEREYLLWALKVTGQTTTFEKGGDS